MPRLPLSRFTVHLSDSSLTPTSHHPTYSTVARLYPILVRHREAHPPSATDPSLVRLVPGKFHFDLTLAARLCLAPPLLTILITTALRLKKLLSLPDCTTANMSADTSDLTKVDSAIGGVDTTAAKDGAKEASKRRTTSSAPGVMNIAELGRHYKIFLRNAS